MRLARRALGFAAGVYLAIDLGPMHRNLTRSVDAHAHLVAGDRHDSDLDVVADHDALVALSREYEDHDQFDDGGDPPARSGAETPACARRRPVRSARGWRSRRPGRVVRQTGQTGT